MSLFERVRRRVVLTDAGRLYLHDVREALARLGEFLPGLTAADCVAVEDSPVGVGAAMAAGLPTVGVPSALPLASGAATVQWDTLAGRTLADLAAVRPGGRG